MPKRQVFYSFHYDNDCFRAQQIRNIGAIEGNTLASPNDWEEVKRGGDKAIQNWIDNSLQNRSCTIVLIGSETAKRKWIEYEIKQSYNLNKGLFGIYIHNLSAIGGTCKKGENPFANIHINGTMCTYANIIDVYDPPANNTYQYIADNIDTWIETAIRKAQNR